MLDGSAIILGFTGSIGSGCTYISETIPIVSSNPYKHYKLSDIIRDELRRKGNDDPSVIDMQREGNNLRDKHGPDILATMIIDQLNKDEEHFTHIIIDGIKNDGEANFLRQFPNFYLFSVNADRDIRQPRVVGSDKAFANDDDFILSDNKDASETSENGQQVKRCNHIADIIIVNNTPINSTAPRIKHEFVSGINRKYIELIENNASGRISPETTPSVNELCMTIAYAMSKKSSCLKRKVGAVIIDLKEDTAPQTVEEKALTIPHVIASGYNEVPAGSYKCIFDKDFQKCYRDHLQEEHAKKMKHCPTCGEALHPTSTCTVCGKEHDHFTNYCRECQQEIKVPYLCPKCDTKVFEEYLPGSKKTPGKLLDLCRALHAEEMAILQLAKRGGKGTGDLVLFATTQPCNLCANKITTTGIRKVVYAEPYNMKEAAEILKEGDVTLERFEGVKSSAFFKLYN